MTLTTAETIRLVTFISSHSVSATLATPLTSDRCYAEVELHLKTLTVAGPGVLSNGGAGVTRIA